MGDVLQSIVLGLKLQSIVRGLELSQFVVDPLEMIFRKIPIVKIHILPVRLGPASR